MHTTLTIVSKTCLECNGKINGRSDKKFCCDQCRSSHHRKHQYHENSFVKQTNVILKINRQILEDFVKEKIRKVHKEKLLDAGFRFSYFTNECKAKGGKTYRFCYEFGYTETQTQHFILAKRNDILK